MSTQNHTSALLFSNKHMVNSAASAKNSHRYSKLGLIMDKSKCTFSALLIHVSLCCKELVATGVSVSAALLDGPRGLISPPCICLLYNVCTDLFTPRLLYVCMQLVMKSIFHHKIPAFRIEPY